MSAVLIHAPNWLGDSILSRYAVASLLHARDGRAAVVAHPRVAAVWRAWPGLTVVETRTGPWFVDACATARHLRVLGPWEEGFLFSASFRSAATFVLAGVQRRVGFAAGGRSFLLTDPVARVPSGRLHYAREFFNLLPSGVARHDPPEFSWPESATPRALAALASHGLAPGGYVVIAPGSAGGAKRYPPAAWRAVVRQMGPRLPVVLVGTEAEAEWAQSASEGQDGHVANLCGATDVPMLARLLQHARAFAGADSGAAHLAAAVGCPVVVLFGPGDPLETAPVGREVTVLRDGLWCSPCRSRRCLRPDALSECMDRIPPEAVAEALLERAGPGR